MSEGEDMEDCKRMIEALSKDFEEEDDEDGKGMEYPDALGRKSEEME